MTGFFRVFFFCSLSLMVLFSTPASSQPSGTACAIYAEQGGLLIFETESASPTDDWSFQNGVSGALGDGYLEWKHGNDSGSIDKAGGGILSYTFQIQTPGTYRFILRSAAPHNTEHNDVWARFTQNEVYGRKSNGSSEVDLGRNSWFKVYQNKGNDSWNWAASTVDHNAHQIFAEITAAGTYSVQLSGRSTKFKIDRIVLFHESVPQNTATNDDNTESPCDDGGGGTKLRPPEPPVNAAPGLQYAYYEGEWDVLPDFSGLQPVKTGTTARINLDPRNREDRYGFLFSAYLDVPGDDFYTFYTTSDDGSQLFIGDQLVVNNDGIHAAVEAQGIIGLQQGLHPIVIYYFERTGQDSLSVSWSGPNLEKTQIASNAFVYDTDNLLPVELTSFDVLVQSDAVALTWETVSELNNAGFEIERSIGPFYGFETIDFVEGAGTTQERRRYTYLDQTVPPYIDEVHYRLKQVDFDGTFSYSSIVSARVLADPQIQLHPNYPNPFNPSTTLSFWLPIADDVNLEVYDLSGRLVETLFNHRLEAGYHEVSYQASSERSSGTYIYRLTTSTRTLSGTMLLLK